MPGCSRGSGDGAGRRAVEFDIVVGLQNLHGAIPEFPEDGVDFLGGGDDPDKGVVKGHPACGPVGAVVAEAHLVGPDDREIEDHIDIVRCYGARVDDKRAKGFGGVQGGRGLGTARRRFQVTGNIGSHGEKLVKAVPVGGGECDGAGGV